MKKLFVVVALILACHKDEAPPHVTPEPSAVASTSASVTPSATSSATSVPSASTSVATSAPPRPPSRVACGAITCEPDEFCLHYDSNSGGAYSPDKHPTDATVCSRELLHNGSMNCGPPNAARQAQCAAFIPRAPPHGNATDPLN